VPHSAAPSRPAPPFRGRGNGSGPLADCGEAGVGQTAAESRAGWTGRCANLLSRNVGMPLPLGQRNRKRIGKLVCRRARRAKPVRLDLVDGHGRVANSIRQLRLSQVQSSRVLQEPAAERNLAVTTDRITRRHRGRCEVRCVGGVGGRFGMGTGQQGSIVASIQAKAIGESAHRGRVWRSPPPPLQIRNPAPTEPGLLRQLLL
jgi:hypothetical protein